MDRLDFERCYRAVETRDARFDGWFITGVTSTGIYCRPSCPTPVQPLRKNVAFFPTTAAAQGAGLRACKRCRPDASPGSPEWDLRADLAGRAMRLIADGVVDRDGVRGLANQLAVSERNLVRILQREVGASPIALARAQRARTARVLIETTDLPVTEVAFAAGFSSIRQFNDTIREVFALTPRELRNKSSHEPAPVGRLGLRLAVRAPIDTANLFRWIAHHTPDGIATVSGLDSNSPNMRRSLSLPKGFGIITLTPSVDHIWCEVDLDDFGDLATAVSRARRLLDLDADPATIQERLAETPLAKLVASNPGLRVPGTVDGFEQAVLTILGQQVSIAAARTFANRLVQSFGTELDRNPSDEISDGITHGFPSAGTLADADLTKLGITGSRQRTISTLARAVDSGDLDLSPGAHRIDTRTQLLDLPGIGPWTADIIAMRALGDPDVFPVGDLVLRKAAAALGLPSEPKALALAAAEWSPWQSYAAHHLWSASGVLAKLPLPKKIAPSLATISSHERETT